MDRLRSAVLGWLLTQVLPAAQAQTTTVLPSPAQRCLTRGDLVLGTPAYPQRALEAKASGRVAVELEFSTPDGKPRLLKIDATGQPNGYAGAFEESVRQFIEAYRVPCLKPGEV